MDIECILQKPGMPLNKGAGCCVFRFGMTGAEKWVVTTALSMKLVSELRIQLVTVNVLIFNTFFRLCIKNIPSA